MKKINTNLKNGKISISIRADKFTRDEHENYCKSEEVNNYLNELTQFKDVKCCYYERQKISEPSGTIYPSLAYNDECQQIPNIEGIKGNSNPHETKYHGWRGTTNDIAIYAVGLRKIDSIEKFKKGYGYKIILGKDFSK